MSVRWTPARGVSRYRRCQPVRQLDNETHDATFHQPSVSQEFAAFEWAEPASEVLDWDMRRPRILEELKRSRADVICLQEVEFEISWVKGDDLWAAAEDTYCLPAWLELEGYAWQIPCQSDLAQIGERNERVLRKKQPIGNAILFRTDRLQHVGPGAGAGVTAGALSGECVNAAADNEDTGGGADKAPADKALRKLLRGATTVLVGIGLADSPLA